MRNRALLWVLMMLLVVAAAAPSAARQVDRPVCGQTMNTADAVFCDGYFALCIKALCKPTSDPAKVECHCEVENGWSMGPAACGTVGRKQTKPPAGGPIMSTYSNAFNTKFQTLTCSSEQTKWAWCYGAPCKTSADGKSATCVCPVCTSAASTLGGNCNPANCSQIWSAATPSNDKIANDYFYAYLTKQGVSAPKPATACTNNPPSH